MNITHTVRVLLETGIVERHYVEAKEPDSSDYMGFNRGDFIGWEIDDSFYNKDKVIGVKIEKFKGIVVMVDGYQVVVEEAQDLMIAVQAQIGVRIKEIEALRGYLERTEDVHPNEQHAGVGSDPGDARPEGVDQKNQRQNC